MTYQNIWFATKGGVIEGKFIAIEAYLKKHEKFHNQSNFMPKQSRKKRTSDTQVSRRKEMI